MIEFLAANWLWIAAIGFFLAMHRSGHGCGMHGGHGGHRHTDSEHSDHHNGPAERADTDRSTT